MMTSKIRKRKPYKPESNETNDQNKVSLLKFNNSNIFKSTICLFLFGTLCLLYATNNFSENVSDNTFVPFGGMTTFPITDFLGSKFWSTLIGGHYFGLKSARPNSTIVSLMWFKNKVETNGLSIRHWCTQEDNIDKYFWTYNDLKQFGHQSIFDQNLRLNTSFIKATSEILHAKITIADTLDHDQYNSIIIYIASENPNDDLKILDNVVNRNGISFQAETQTSGNYVLNLKVTKGNLILQSHLNANTTLSLLKETIYQNLYVYKHSKKSVFIISNSDKESSKYKSTFIAYQIVFHKHVEVDIEMLFNGVTSQLNFDYDKELQNKREEFDTRFEDKFNLHKNNFSEEKIAFARTVLSNTIGGISYFYGSSIVKSRNSLPAPYGPIELLTAVPSRSFFPRGFLWDEGFHQLLISTWDPELSMIIIKSWLNLMNDEGWIPREVILGDEAQARVPNEFLVQYSSNANPPALFLAIEELIDHKQANQEWLRDIYPRLKKWFNWFNTTQTGTFPTTFRWRGRNSTTNLELNPKTLASGLDDFPRATHPTDQEIHLDLRCWIALACRIMAKISKTLLLNDYEFERFYHILKDNQLLEQWHWSEKYKMFCDKGLHSTKVMLKPVRRNGVEYFERQCLIPPQYDCIPEFGYVSLFPFVMTLIEPDNPKLLKVLEDIEDPQLLWSPYGLRSLAVKSFYYDKYNTKDDGPYWRGSIWININFLVLKALNYYSNIPGPYQTKANEIHRKLQYNLVENVYKEFMRTGYIFEQYSDKNGKGIGKYPFTGWSALIVKIMSENKLTNM